VWWAATDPVLNALSLDSHLDRESVRSYTLWSIPSLLPIAFNVAVASQLVSVQLPFAPMVVEIVCCAFDAGAMYLFIFGVPPALRGYGVVGSALGMFVSQAVASLCYAISAYVLLRGRLRVLPKDDTPEASDTDAAVCRLSANNVPDHKLIPAADSETTAGLPSGTSSNSTQEAGTWIDAPWTATWAFCRQPRNWGIFFGQVHSFT
jgi:hypothetical protein